MTLVLIVDDQEQNLYLLQALLQGQGYEVRSARNGIEALDMARRQAPDLIITDILMPGMDGFSLCREWMVDEKLKHVPLVFYTATYTDSQDEAFALGLGAARFVVKPTEPDAFVEILRQVLETHAAQRLVLPDVPSPSAEVYYQQYNQALIRKLEDKTLQLEEANRALELDITERKQVEETLRQSEARLHKPIRAYAMLSDVNQAIVRLREPQAVFDQVCRIAVQVGGLRMAWIGLVDESSQQLQVVAHASGDDVYFEQAVVTLREELVDDCPIQNALRGGQRTICNTMGRDALCQKIAFELGVRSSAAFPLLVSAKIRGAVNFYSNEPDFFDEEETKLLDELAMDISFAVEFAKKETERKRAETQLNEQLDELRRWRTATLGRETRILDLKGEVNELLVRAGQPPRYPSAEMENQ